jgi:RsiW-degrading membrane proteinase PrsW (M82 family)
MEFKQLELEPESSQTKRVIQLQHIKRTVIYIVLGAVVSFLFFYFTEGQRMDVIAARDIIKSILIGGFFGFFITNSPCARNRC